MLFPVSPRTYIQLVQGSSVRLSFSTITDQLGWDIGVLGEYTPCGSSRKVGPMALNEKARFEFPP